MRFRSLKRGLVVVVSTSLAGILLAACQPQMQAASAKIESDLEAKYGQSFKVEEIGAGYGTSDNSTWKATVVPSSDPSLRFAATVKKDLSEVRDRFVGAGITAALSSQLASSARTAAGAEATAVAMLDYTKAGDADERGRPGMGTAAYFAENPEVGVGAVVLVGVLPTEVDGRSVARKVGDSVAEVAPQGLIDVGFFEAEAYRGLNIEGPGTDYQDASALVWNVSKLRFHVRTQEGVVTVADNLQ